MDQALRALITVIERYTFDSGTPIFPFDGLFIRVPPPLLEAFLLHAAANPRVPRRLGWEAAVVCAQHTLVRRDAAHLERAEALPSLASEATVVDRMIAHALRGRARLEYVRTAPWYGADRQALIRGARDDLDHAVALAEQYHLPRAQRFAALVSAGNAWRTPPEDDAGEAIARYEHAARIGAEDPGERARLAKCFADGLIARGEPADLDRAVELLQASLKVRRGGPFESETLLSLATAERDRRRDRTAGDCEHVHRILLAAQRRDALGNAERIAQQRVEVLGVWLRHQPGAKEPARALEEIAAAFPALRPSVEFAKCGGGPVPDGFDASILRLQHPAAWECLNTLLIVDERPPLQRTATPEMLSRLPRGHLDEVERFMRARSIASDPERLAALAAELRDAGKDDGTPGRLVARARTLARLTLFGCATRSELVEAAREAEASLAGVDDLPVRGFLLMELASVWGPGDLEHPVRDFAEAARLHELAVDAAKGDEHLRLDALLQLARATQHRTDGDLSAHREHAAAIYAEIVRQAPALGAAATLASARQNLAALATAGGTGAEAERSASARELHAGADDLGSPMGFANLAWDLTLQASHRGSQEGAEPLREALALFGQVPMERLTESERINVEHNRTVAETVALEFEGRLEDAAQRWRQRLEDDAVRRRPDLLARTRHNLGDRLMRDPGTADEGLRVLEAALEGRPLDRAPREHWETSLSIAMALGAMLARVRPWTVRVSPRDAHRRALSAARGAVSAARRLGFGEELARAGQHVCQLALLAEDDDDFEPLMEEGWRAISDALPCMLGDDEAAEREARLAEAAALRVFRARREGSVVGLLRERVEVLHGEAASAVLTWMERAMLPQQRRLAARLARPAWCDEARWRTWEALLDARDPSAIARWVEAARREHPDFLDPTGVPHDTTTWLRGAPTRGVMALLPTQEGVLAAVETDADGARLALLPPPLAPVPPEDLPELLADLPSSADAAKLLDHAASAARDALTEPLQALVTEPLRQVRLAVGARLRWLPPSALLPGAVVHASPSARVPRRPAAPKTNGRRVALIAADPAGDLGRGVEEVAQLSRDFAPAAGVATVLGRGARWGRALGIPAEGLVDRPPSPEALLALAAEAEVVVVLAHGRVIDAAGPALELMDDRGKVARLGVRGIAAQPTFLAARHLVLLSCEAGFVDATPHRLGLLLGELLACGPASVTAASWAVPLECALTVGRFVVGALLQGREPEEGLKEAIDQLLAVEPGGGPLLGRRLDPADRRAARVAAARAWITWRP